MVHKNLSRERPYYVPQHVPCDVKLIQVECRGGIVWALTEDRNLIIRMGVVAGREEGEWWHYLGV